MPKPEYKKYVPVRRKDENPRIDENIISQYVSHPSYEGLFRSIREISALGDEKRREEFEKIRKTQTDIQPLFSPETYDGFFKNVVPGFRTITDPKEIEERQKIHDLAWDTLQEYAQKVLPINKPVEYPEHIDRFAQILFFGLQKPEDKQKLYELTLQNENPRTGDPKMQEEYATLVKHSIDYMLKMEGQIERINKLDNEEFLKKIMPYMGLVVYMGAADDSLKITGVSGAYDEETKSRIRNLNSVGIKSISRLQRMLDTHYPAMTFKDQSEMTFTELNQTKYAIDLLDDKVVNGVLGLDLLSSDARWTFGLMDKETLTINPIVYGKMNEALGMDIEQYDDLCYFVDADGNKLEDKTEAARKLDQGELVYAQSRKNLEKNIHESKQIPLYCGGSIKENKVLSGDEALKQFVLDNKEKTYSVEDELKKYDQAHPKPTISWWDKMVANVVSAVTFNKLQTTTWAEYMEKTDAWERDRKAEKEKFTKQKELFDERKTGKMSKKTEEKLKELRNTNEIAYENQFKEKESEIIRNYITDESKVNVNASIEKMKAAQISGDGNELAKGLAEVIAANAVQEKLLEHVGSKKFANEFADITASFDKEKEVSKLMQSDEFREFFKRYDFDKVKNIDRVRDTKDIYKDYLKVAKTMHEKAPQLENNKPQLEDQKSFQP